MGVHKGKSWNNISAMIMSYVRIVNNTVIKGFSFVLQCLPGGISEGCVTCVVQPQREECLDLRLPRCRSYTQTHVSTTSPSHRENSSLSRRNVSKYLHQHLSIQNTPLAAPGLPPLSLTYSPQNPSQRTCSGTPSPGCPSPSGPARQPHTAWRDSRCSSSARGCAPAGRAAPRATRA